MLQRLTRPPRRILMTLDAVGGVWRHAVDLARGLAAHDCATLFVGQGPQPSAARRLELERIPGSRLVWLEQPLDWMAGDPAELATLPATIAGLAQGWRVDLVHLNLPSQAARLRLECPVVVASHSCLSTWWAAMRDGPLPRDWRWQHDLTRQGLAAADLVLAPSASHAAAIRSAYGLDVDIRTVHNGTQPAAWPRRSAPLRRPFVFAAARWWDEAKNGRLMDEAAAGIAWPVLLAGSCKGPQGQGIDFAWCRALGDLPHGEVGQLMAQAGLFVSPSLYEPFGLAALEAAAGGAPLVLADIPTYRELWDGCAAFFDPQDPESLARVLVELAEDVAARRALGEAARERSGRYTLEAQAARVLALYGEAQHLRQPAPQNLTV